jgi:REP element-mobilizing transposase RayT
MTLPRSTLIDPACTPYYHCVSRCVRRAFLCGRDALTGYDFEHRRGWIERRLLRQAEIFAIDVCAYAVMSNHYHVVLRINVDQVRAWRNDDIVARWERLHRVPEWFASADEETIRRTISIWRERLGSISWFMKCLNEPLARMANKEDGCKGRFWEGRFRSQALLDEAAVLKCMAYVDLNPIRAGRAATPEDSAHTSIQARIQNRDAALAPMADAQTSGFTLPIRKAEYLALVDWTGRQLRPGKRGRIAASEPPIIERLRRSAPRAWLEEMSHLTRHYCRAIGTMISLSDYRDRLGQGRLKGLTDQLN